MRGGKIKKWCKLERGVKGKKKGVKTKGHETRSWCIFFTDFMLQSQ